MSERKRATEVDWTKVDAHEITAAEYNDIPELTDEDFARGRWHIGGVPVRRGRPKAKSPKQAVSLRLDPDVLTHFRATGPGWQRRINDTLRKAAKLINATKLKDKVHQPATKARAASK
jgi:uncharacterized protein (DUF4415 family)